MLLELMMLHGYSEDIQVLIGFRLLLTQVVRVAFACQQLLCNNSVTWRMPSYATFFSHTLLATHLNVFQMTRWYNLQNRLLVKESIDFTM